MINVTKAIKKQVYIVEVEAIRRGCRIAAKKNKANGNYANVKHWNDIAYKGDCLLAQIKAW